MAKFGRFEFGKADPTETYEGGCIKLEKGCVKILRVAPDPLDLQPEEIVAVIHLDRGQSVREIKRTKT